jgi:hypothetical protein
MIDLPIRPWFLAQGELSGEQCSTGRFSPGIAPRRRAGYTATKPPRTTVDAMTYAVVEDVAASWETYERFAVDLERSRPDGLILHAAGRTDEGVRVIEVWESEEAWRRHAEASGRSSEKPFWDAPRHLRELRPSHLVIAGTTLDPEQPVPGGGRPSTARSSPVGCEPE